MKCERVEGNATRSAVMTAGPGVISSINAQPTAFLASPESWSLACRRNLPISLAPSPRGRSPVFISGTHAGCGASSHKLKAILFRLSPISTSWTSARRRYLSHEPALKEPRFVQSSTLSVGFTCHSFCSEAHGGVGANADYLARSLIGHWRVPKRRH